MNVLMLTMSLGIGGAETHILELSRALIARGHKVTVAASGGLFVDSLITAGARHVSVPLHRKDPASLTRAMRVLTKDIKETGYDVIHAHARIPGFLGEILAKRFDIPFVTTFHGTFNPVWYWRMLTRVGERTLAVSDDIKEYLMHYYRTPAEKIHITVNGIDTGAFSADGAKTDLSLPEGEKILTVTRLDKESAWHAFRLIEAMPEILTVHPRARLVIVGGGDALPEIRALADATDETLGGNRIFVLGPRSDIARLLPGADVFVGVSRAAMEAMAAKIPVVLSGAQGHLGIFTEPLEKEAILTNFCCRGRAPADAHEIAAGVITVLTKSEAERKVMGEYNRSVIEKYYSVRRMTDDAEDLYKRAIREHIPKRGDVLISGYYGFSNAGDDALLSAISTGLRECGVKKIAALSRKNVQPAVGVKPVSRFHPVAVFRAVRHAKLLISGGGSLFQDATSSKSLWYYAAIIRLAHRAGVPVMIYGNGIGPIRRKSNRKIAAAAARRADYISVREPTSKRELISMGIPEEKILVTADPVYRTHRAADERDAEERIVVSLRELAGQSARQRDGAALEDAVVRALVDVCRRRSLSVRLLPMQPRYDAAISQRVCGRLREAGVEADCSAARSAEEIFGEIKSARAVLGMRLHTLIFATAAGVPTAAISYDPKVDALMDYLNLSDYALSDESPDADEIAAVLTRALTDETLPDHLRARTEALRTLAEKDVDEAVRLWRK